MSKSDIFYGVLIAMLFLIAVILVDSSWIEAPELMFPVF